MPPEDRQRLQDDKKKIERTLESNRAALDRVRHKSGKYGRTLISAGAAIQSARSDLRRAGYLKK